MIQVKCIQKFRDKNNHIYGYRIVDINGQTQDVKSEELKQAIKNKQLHVINLRLTSDNRLVDTTEKQLQKHNIKLTDQEILRKVLKGIIYNLGSEYIMNTDKQYRDSCSCIDVDSDNKWYVFTSTGGLTEFISESYFSALKIETKNNNICIKQYLAILEYGDESDDRIERINKEVFNGKINDINISRICDTVKNNTETFKKIITLAENLTKSIEFEESDSDNFADACIRNTTISNAKKFFVDNKVLNSEQFDDYVLHNFDEDETILNYIKAL